MVSELPSPPQRARPFHSHSIQNQASPFHLSIAKSCRPKQFHSTFRGASSVPSPWFFGWDISSGLSSSFGVLTACSAESLGQSSFFVTGTGAHPDAFHCHRVPDPFQLPLVMDSWKFIIEVHWTWSELHWSLFDIGRVFFWKERYWEIFLGFARSCTKPPSWDARRAYLSFFPYFCRYRFVLAVLWVEDGSYWSTMVSDCFTVGRPGSDSSMLVCRKIEVILSMSVGRGLL